MIFCEKKQSSSANKVATKSKLQTKLDADLKKQQTPTQDEESCCKSAEKFAWVTKQTGCNEMGMTKTQK